MILGCENIDVCGTHTVSGAFVQVQRYRAYSVIRRLVLSSSIDEGKNGVWGMWLRPSSLVRPQAAPNTRSVLRGHSDLPGNGGPAYRLQAMRQGEAGEAGLAFFRPVRHQTII